MESISLISIISIAFLGSFGHCVGMCGGIVVAYTSKKIGFNWSKSQQTLAHLLYSFGRITTYVVLGALFGFVGGVVSFDNLTSGVLLIFTGVLMILIGISLSGKFTFMKKIEHSISNTTIYKSFFHSLVGSDSFSSFYLLGMLNGLLPCGFVYVFAITAASTGSPLWGAIVMFVFGLSTLPALFSLGVFVGVFKQIALRNVFIRIASILVIMFGFYIMYNGYMYITDPSKTILDCHI